MMTVQRRMRIVGDSENVDSGIGGLCVAFATDDMSHVNQHFGSAKSLVIYQVSPKTSQLLEVAEFHYENHDDNEGKLGEKIEMLKNCIAVYSQAVGSSASQKLIAAGVQPVKIRDDAEISTLIKYLQEEMLQGPSAWLAKAIKQQKNPDYNPFENMETEKWEE
jgi:nitrogen fixation protein NifX